jgi:hypothetical protein
MVDFEPTQYFPSLASISDICTLFNVTPKHEVVFNHQVVAFTKQLSMREREEGRREDGEENI